MCVNILYPPPYDKQGVAYKVVDTISASRFAPPLFGTFCRWSIGDTIVDMFDCQLDADRNTSYRTGFHLWASLKDAEVYSLQSWMEKNTSIVKVEYTDVTAVGLQRLHCGLYGVCVVARKIKLVERISSDYCSH